MISAAFGFRHKIAIPVVHHRRVAAGLYTRSPIAATHYQETAVFCIELCTSASHVYTVRTDATTTNI